MRGMNGVSIINLGFLQSVFIIDSYIGRFDGIKVLKTRSMKQYTERWIYLSIYTLYIYKNIAQIIIIINETLIKNHF